MTRSDDRLKVCNLASFTDSELVALATLQISDQQEMFGGSFSESLDAWRVASPEHVLGLCFLFEERPVGMAMFRRPPSSPAWVPQNAMSIHGLKIAKPWQGLGFGQIAFRLAVDRARKEWPSTRSLVLAADEANTAALAIYRGYGMYDSGPIFDGRCGREHRFEKVLSSSVPEATDPAPPQRL